MVSPSIDAEPVKYALIPLATAIEVLAINAALIEELISSLNDEHQDALVENCFGNSVSGCGAGLIQHRWCNLQTDNHFCIVVSNIHAQRPEPECSDS